MTLVLHLAWTDMKALRWPLAGWVAYLLAAALWFHAGAWEVAAGKTSAVRLADLGWFGAYFIGTAGLVGYLVQLDPTAGETAFWRSRPLGGLTVLLSKLATITLWMVALPVLVSGGTLVALGLPADQALAGSRNLGMQQAIISLVAAAGAAVTPNLIAFSAVVVGVAAISGNIASGVSRSLARAWPTLESLGAAAGMFGVLGFFAAVTIGALVLHYRTLNVRRSRYLFPAILLIGMVVAGAVPVTVDTPGVLDRDAEQRAGLSGLTLAASADSQRVDWSPEPYHSGQPRISFVSALSGADPTVVFRAEHVDTEIQFNDGTTTGWSSDDVGAVDRPTAFPETSPTMEAAIASAVGTPKVVVEEGLATFFSGRTTLLELPRPVLERHRGETVRIRSWVRVWVYRVRLAAAEPLRGRSRLSTPLGVLLVDHVQRDSRKATLDLRFVHVVDQETVSPIFDFFRWRMCGVRDAARGVSAVVIPDLLSNRPVRLFSPWGPISYRFTQTIDLGDPAGGPSRVDGDQSADAEIVQLECSPVGIVVRPVAMDGVVLGGTPRADR